MKSRVHPTCKTQYHVQNWAAYDRALVCRGDITIGLSPADVTPIRRPARSPNLTAYTERFVRTIKDSCLERMVPIGEARRVAPSASSSRTTTTNGITRGSVGCCTTPIGQPRDT